MKNLLLFLMIAGALVAGEYRPDVSTTVDGVEYTFHNSTADESWRLVHDGAVVHALFFGEGYTTTIKQLFVAATAQECLDEIARLGLEYTPGEFEADGSH